MRVNEVRNCKVKLASCTVAFKSRTKAELHARKNGYRNVYKCDYCLEWHLGRKVVDEKI